MIWCFTVSTIRVQGGFTECSRPALLSQHPLTARWRSGDDLGLSLPIYIDINDTGGPYFTDQLTSIKGYTAWQRVHHVRG